MEFPGIQIVDLIKNFWKNYHPYLLLRANGSYIDSQDQNLKAKASTLVLMFPWTLLVTMPLLSVV